MISYWYDAMITTYMHIKNLDNILACYGFKGFRKFRLAQLNCRNSYFVLKMQITKQKSLIQGLVSKLFILTKQNNKSLRKYKILKRNATILRQFCRLK